MTAGPPGLVLALLVWYYHSLVSLSLSWLCVSSSAASTRLTAGLESAEQLESAAATRAAGNNPHAKHTKQYTVHWPRSSLELGK